MAVCPICGCKTDELDFVERKINEADCKVCSFCNRQLNVFDTVNEPTEAQLRWIVAVINKDVPDRTEDVFAALKSIYSKYSENEISQPAEPSQQRVSVVPQGSAKRTDADDNTIVELKNRITALENEIRAMKRKQMIKNIIELGAPFALLLILVIVFLSSGILDNIRTIFDMAGIAL